MKISRMNSREIWRRLNDFALNKDTNSRYYRQLKEEIESRDGQKVYRELNAK